MEPSQTKPTEIAIVGLGGIGSWVLQGLVPFLAHQDSPYLLHLIDGDDYEESNRSRQAFDEIGPKAEVQAKWIYSRFPNVSVRPHAEYLTPENAERLLKTSQIVFSCLDNHKTRKLLNDHATTRETDIALISGGNELEDGNVQFLYKYVGPHMMTCSLTKYHPEIESPQDKSPHEMSCEELANHSPQVIFTNMMAANLMLNTFYQMQKGKVEFEKSEIYFDITTNVSKPRLRKP